MASGIVKQVMTVWKIQFFLTTAMFQNVILRLLQHLFWKLSELTQLPSGCISVISWYKTDCMLLPRGELTSQALSEVNKKGHSHNAMEKYSVRESMQQKNTFLNLPQLQTSLPESFEHQSLCLMHVIKSTNLNFKHTKYEPDCLTHAWEKGHITITVDCGPPCIINLNYSI